MALFLKRSSSLLIIGMAIHFLSCKEGVNSYKSKNGNFELNVSNHIPMNMSEGNIENLNFEVIVRPTDDKDMDLSWEVIKSEFPATFEYSFCDNTGCYFDLPSKNKLNKFNSKDEADERTLKLQVNTNGSNKKFTFNIKLISNNSSECDTLYFSN